MPDHPVVKKQEDALSLTIENIEKFYALIIQAACDAENSSNAFSMLGQLYFECLRNFLQEPPKVSKEFSITKERVTKQIDTLNTANFFKDKLDSKIVQLIKKDIQDDGKNLRAINNDKRETLLKDLKQIKEKIEYKPDKQQLPPTMKTGMVLPESMIVISGQDQKISKDMDNPVEQFNRGISYLQKDEKKAVELFKKAANQGFAKAQGALGACYEDGKGVPKDATQAFIWYEKAAQQGLSTAQNKVGTYYEDGRGAPKDTTQAFTWYEKAAQQGLPTAQYNLGGCYMEGVGVSKDPIQAFAWYEKAAQQGLPIAQHNLGVCYENGIGIPADTKQAIKWQEKAAQQGLPSAQFNLALYYYEGKMGDVKQAKDEKKAVAWFKKAAEQGLANAQFNLGVCYEGGIGIPPDIRQAIKWYKKAAQQGHQSAQRRLSRRDLDKKRDQKSSTSTLAATAASTGSPAHPSAKSATSSGTLPSPTTTQHKHK